MEESTYKHISAEEFANIDHDKVTLVDLREPDELLVSGIDSAINIPFSGGFDKLDTIPKDKPVIVFCRVGDWSEEVAEILSDRGYDVTTLDGGYNSYRELTARKPDQEDPLENPAKDYVVIDAKGLKCPGPIVKVADHLRDKPVGNTVIVEATEDAFESDIKVWCDRTGNHLDELIKKDGVIRAKITRAEKVRAPQVKEQNDKTFVVFSGDHDAQRYNKTRPFQNEHGRSRCKDD